MGKVSVITGLDPTLGLGVLIGGSEMAALYDTLMTLDSTTGEFVPNVAESLTLESDGATWTLVLRPDVQFTNGDPLTADVVKQNLERTMASKATHATQLNFVDALEVVDELTLTLHTDKPSIVPPLLAAESGMMINPKFFGDPDALNAAPPEGSTLGPFLFEEWLDGEELTLKRNPDYWGGEVCADGVKFKYITSPDALVDAYELGEVDIAQFRNASQAIAEMKALGSMGFSISPGGSRAIVMNVREGFATADPRLRSAIAMAIDYPLLLERVNGGEGQASGSIYPESSRWYPGAGVGYDVDGAKALVDELRTEGVDLNLEFLVMDRADWAEVGIAVKAMLENIGMQIELVTVPTATLQQRLYTDQDFELVSWAITAREDLPAVYVGNALRNAGIDDPDMNAAVDALWSATTDDEIVPALEEVQALWNQLLPEVLLTHDEIFAGLHDEVSGVVMSSDAKLLFANASRE